MPVEQFTNKQILERMQVLHDKMEEQGLYVMGNTVFLGMELIKTLETKLAQLEEDLREADTYLADLEKKHR